MGHIVIKGAFKQRMVGAIFILSLGVILIPVILDAPSDDPQPYYSVMPEAPSLPEVSEASKINYVFNGLDNVLQEPAEVAAPPKQVAEVKLNRVPEPVAASHASVPAPAPAQGEWTIQLGAFSSTENANELLQRLSQKGFESYLKTTPGKKLVRVFVAPGVQKEKAQALQTKLDSQLGLKGILVRYQEP
jgi:DedD protein